jgi:hypothetical protein
MKEKNNDKYGKDFEALPRVPQMEGQSKVVADDHLYTAASMCYILSTFLYSASIES